MASFYSTPIPAIVQYDDSGKSPNDSSDDNATTFSTIFNCSLSTPFDKDSNLNFFTATLCTLYLFFGIWCTFFGYRCFKAIMFFTGFIFGSVVVYLICIEEDVLPMWANAFIGFGAGILFGLITLLVQYVGLFMMGFHGGLLLGTVGLLVIYVGGQSFVNADADLEGHSLSPWISIGTLLASGLLLSLCNLYFQKSLTIFSSAFYGGAVIATCIDYFVEDSRMLMWVWDEVRVKKPPDPEELCWFSWAILGIWPLLLVAGVISQIVISGKELYHEEPFPNVKHRRRKRETREERKQRKYRYFYQVRTCHGDVISQPIPEKHVHQVNVTSP